MGCLWVCSESSFNVLAFPLHPFVAFYGSISVDDCASPHLQTTQSGEYGIVRILQVH